MNNADERFKGIIAGLVILISLGWSFISIRSKFAPATPEGPSPAAQIASAQAAASTNPATAAAAIGPASGGSTPAPSANALLPDHPMKVIVKNLGPRPTNTVVRDPFAISPDYERKIGPEGFMAMGSAAHTSGTGAPSSVSHSRMSHGLLDLPPAGINLGSLAGSGPVSSHPASPSLFPLPTASSPASSASPGAPSSAAGPSTIASSTAESNAAKPAPEAPEPSFALTGTIAGDLPLAILRSGDRSYLVHEGDWLEGRYRVRRILPRRVVLSDRFGHPQTLDLGASPHAI